MRALSILIALLAPLLANAATTESCEQLRARIGVPPLADHNLLRDLAVRKDCGFTAGEVYRAAYGDKPLPPPESRERRRHHDRHGDDDD